MQAENRVRVLRIVDLAKLRGDKLRGDKLRGDKLRGDKLRGELLVHRSVADHIPGRDARLRDALHDEAGRAHRHVAGAVRDEDRVDQRRRSGRQLVDLDVAEEALGLRIAGFAAAWVDPEPLFSGAAAVTAADDVGQIDRLACQRVDVDPRLGDSGGDVGLRLRVLPFGRGARATILPCHTGKDGREGVILPLQDRIELVVVAAGAVDRHAAAAGHHLRDHVVEVVGTGLPPQHVALGLDLADEIPRACREESGGDHRVGIVGRDHVAGDLSPKKLVVGEVGIERLDHPVAIPPGVGPELVAFEAVGVGVVGDVEPVAGPAFAVVGRGEQAVDEFFIRIG